MKAGDGAAPRGDAAPPRGRIWLAGGLLALAIAAAYFNAQHAPFVFDDIPSLVENPSIRRLWPLTDVLFPSVHGGLTTSGRPLLNLSFALNYAVSGEAVWSYHLANVLIHAGAALVLFGLVRRIWATRAANAEIAALAVAALWALHPLQTESVTYIVQRAESLMGLLFFGTLYLLVRGLQSERPNGWLAASVGTCMLGVGAKEVIAVAPLLALLLDRTFLAGSFREAWRRRRGYYFALAATWLPLGALVLAAGGNRGGTVGFDLGIPWGAYLLTQARALTTYLKLSLWPQPLVFDYGIEYFARFIDALPFVVFVAAILGSTLVALRRWPLVGFAGTWFCVLLAPTSLVPSSVQLIVEHRVYLSLAAVVLLGVVAAHRVGGRKALWASLVLAVVAAGLTVRRNEDYRDALTLWGDTVAKRPGSLYARENYGVALQQAGRLPEAIEQHAAAVRLKPDDAKLHYNLAGALAELGRLPEALWEYEAALRLEPENADVHNNFAAALVRAGRIDEARAHYAAAAQARPQNAQFQTNLAGVLRRLGRFDEAVVHYREALRLQPDADAHHNLASILTESGRPEEALPHFETALRLHNDDVTRGDMGEALLVAGRLDEALAIFRALSARAPGNVAARFGAGSVLAAMGRSEEARTEFEAVLRAEPQNADAHLKLANCLMRLDRDTEAISHYRAGLQMRPDDAEAHDNLGVAYARLGRFAEAEREFLAALRCEPERASAQAHLARVRAALGR